MGDEDVDGKCRNMSACSSTTSYSTKLFLFMVPLVLISAFVFVNIGPKTPTSFLTSLSTTSHHLPPSPSLPPAPAPALSPLPPEILPSLSASSLSTKVESIQVREINYLEISKLFLSSFFISLCMSFLLSGYFIYLFIFYSYFLQTNIYVNVVLPTDII